MSYTYLGNDKFQVILTLYRDCSHEHDQVSIAEDNPALINIYRGDGSEFLLDNIFAKSSPAQVPANRFSCNNPEDTCINIITFEKTYHLPPQTGGYHIVHQRCCRDERVDNIRIPINVGVTYYCTIPPAVIGPNNSAVFKETSPQFIPDSKILQADYSATDPDGDSLSYEFCESYGGGTMHDAKPVPAPPPFEPVIYNNTFSYKNPLGLESDFHIDPVTGIASGTVNTYGIFLIAVACHEWRNGVKINTVRKEYTLMACTNEYLFSVAPNPCTDFIYLNLMNARYTALNIYDMNGALLVKTDLLNGKHQIDMRRYAKGLYILKYSDDHQQRVLKILKQ